MLNKNGAKSFAQPEFSRFSWLLVRDAFVEHRLEPDAGFFRAFKVVFESIGPNKQRLEMFCGRRKENKRDKCGILE